MGKDAASWIIESMKYDGQRHRVWTNAQALQPYPDYRGEFVPYFMLSVKAHTPVIEANGYQWSSPYDVIACFYAAKHYQVMVLCKQPVFEYYCNSCTVAQIDTASRRVWFVDLDLDLVVDKNHVPRVVDREEYEENIVRFGYPDALCQRVEEDLEELTKQVRLQRGIFSPHFTFPKKTSGQNMLF